MFSIAVTSDNDDWWKIPKSLTITILNILISSSATNSKCFSTYINMWIMAIQKVRSDESTLLI